MAAAKLISYVHVGGEVYGPGDRVPAKHAALITNPKAWADGKLPSIKATGDEGEDDTKGYADLKVDELKAEIESRNADREDDAKISTDGVKADLVAALEADDEASADN